MALIKAYKSKHGVSCDYWRIVEIYINAKSNKMTAQIALYVSKAIRNQGAEPVMQATFDGELPPLEARKTNDIIALAYEAVKLQSEFQGAVDD